MPMISAKNIHKAYGELSVLKGIDLDIAEGEVVSIVGSSGAGKSTLLHIIGTLDRADTGEVEIAGVPLPRVIDVKEQFAPKLKRFINWLIDNLLLLAAAYGIAIATAYSAHIMVTLVAWAVLSVFYYTVMEGLFGRTIGKFITNTRVLSRQLNKIGFNQAFGRSLCRLIPFEPLSLLLTSSAWHDALSGTLVLNNSSLVKDALNSPQRVLASDEALANFRNENIGFIFQFHHLLPEFNALENVCIPAFIANKKGETEIKQRGEELLRMIGLGDRMHHRPSELSGGEQQRVAVARALINNPKVVLADEPSGNLDSKNSQELHALFFKLRDELKQTFVIVTHNEDLANMADRKLVMKDGLMV